MLNGGGEECPLPSLPQMSHREMKEKYKKTTNLKGIMERIKEKNRDSVLELP